MPPEHPPPPPSQYKAAAPRLLTKTMDGKGEALLTDAIDYKFVTAAVPARGDEYLTLYLTGLGAVGGAAVAGNASGDGGSLDRSTRLRLRLPSPSG